MQTCDEKVDILQLNIKSLLDSGLGSHLSAEHRELVLQLTEKVGRQLHETLGDRFCAVSMPSFLAGDNAHVVKVELFETVTQDNEALVNEIVDFIKNYAVGDYAIVHSVAIPGQSSDQPDWARRWRIRLARTKSPIDVNLLPNFTVIPKSSSPVPDEYFSGTKPLED